MNLIAKVLAGSKLYRLDGPASDTDYKAIHLPTLEECLLLRAPRNIQRKEGEGAAKVEYESFALTEFLTLAARGEDVVLTMLHASQSDVLETSPIWSLLWTNARRFYTKRMVGALGYAKSQASKYGLRADRMASVDKVIVALEAAKVKGVGRLYQCWDDLPDGDHIVRTISDNNRDGVDKRIYEVAGKGLPATITPDYALDILIRLRDSYGDRVRAAKNMGGSDYKALSHSFRVGYQLLHIYQDGTFSYPLPETDFIRAVKEERCNYLNDKLDEKLNDLITTVETLAEKSTYPERVDSKWMDEIVLKAYVIDEQAEWFKRAMTDSS